MAEDKEKRLRKILVKKGYKGQLKPVTTLEEAHLICIENRQCIHKTQLLGKDTYIYYLEEGYTFPEDLVHYLVSSNPRNARHIEQRFLSNSNGYLKSKPT